MKITNYTYRKPKYLDDLSANNIDTIVIHNTGNNNSLKINTDYHIDHNAWNWNGYGYYINKGLIYKIRGMEHKNAAVKGHNHHTVNIAVQGNYDIDHIADVDKKALEWLIVYLKKENDNIKFIKGHNELNDTKCPGKNFNVEHFTKFLKIKEVNAEALKLKQELINETIRNDSLDNDIKQLKKELELYKANTVLLQVENKKLHKILKKSREYSIKVYNMYQENLREQEK